MSSLLLIIQQPLVLGLLVSLFIGALSGMLGSLSYLRKEAMIGDVASHAALPGLAGAFLLFESKATLALMSGAFISCILFVFFVAWLKQDTRLKSDTRLSLGLSLSFGLGILLLSITQNNAESAQAGLRTYLFGMIAAAVPMDLLFYTLLFGLSTIILAVFWKAIKHRLFDPVHASLAGRASKGIDYLITILLILAVVCGIQAVGVVLMVSMLIAPAAAARPFSRSLFQMVSFSALFGAVFGMAGTLISYHFNFPSGASIVIIASTVAILVHWFRGEKHLAYAGEV